MNITDTLIDFTHSDLTPTARARGIIALSACDWAACGIAGYADGTFTRWAEGQAASGSAPTFAGETLTAAAAALTNGTLSHALDFDDTHFGHIGHPSVVIFPAVMAAKPADWADMIDCALTGFEASIRIGLYLGRTHYQRGFHQTATAGAFGACLGAARAMKLTAAQTRHALGLCATMASGLKTQFGTMGKPLNAGLAARAGVEAAMWARDGMTGADNGIEAFAHAMDAAQDDTALHGIGTHWQVEALSHKFHACCHGLHATLEALSGYQGNSTFEIMVIETHPRWMSVCNQPDPDTGLAAKFSYRHVAAMAMNGVVTGDTASFSDAGAQDPALVAARAKIAVCGADDLSEMQARVTVDGAVLTHDLAAPLALDMLHQKLRTKTIGLIGGDPASMLWDAAQAQNLTAFSAAAFPVNTLQRAPKRPL